MVSADVKLHLGSGKRFIPGFIHVDLADFPHIDYHHDIATLPMFEDGAASLIYSCHAFEYFDREQAAAVLAEYFRVLRPGGVLRLAVPDFAALCELYRRTGELDRIVGPLFGRMPIAGSAATIFHKTTYDELSLTATLAGAGFVNVRRWDWRTTEHAGVDDFSQAYYPHMDKEHGFLISLNIECDRPAPAGQV